MGLLLIGVLSIASAAILVLQAPWTSAQEPRNWPQWRGPMGTGEAPEADPPLEWSEGQNIRWKTSIPGQGHSTPIIWGDRIFLTTAVPVGSVLPPKYSDAPGAHDNLPVTHRYRFEVLAVDRKDGRILWRTPVAEEVPREAGHTTGSLASPSLVTSGRRLFAFFGSRGLFCLDLDGHVLWKKDFGEMRIKHGHGEGASPALYGETLVVNWDHEGQSFVEALDTRSGRRRWKVERQEVTSWATPIIVTHRGRPQVIVSGTRRVAGYDLETGRVIWECGGLSRNVVASPVAGNGLVFVGSSYDTRALFAIQLEGAVGDITGTSNVVWRRSRSTPYVPSPLLYQGSLYYLRHYQGILTRVNAETGEEQGRPIRLRGIRNVYASPVAASGRIYITDLDGTTLVLSHEDYPKLLAVNRLDDSFSASAAPVGQELFLRGRRHLYAIAQTHASDSR